MRAAAPLTIVTGLMEERSLGFLRVLGRVSGLGLFVSSRAELVTSRVNYVATGHHHDQIAFWGRSGDHTVSCTYVYSKISREDGIGFLITHHFACDLYTPRF